MSRRTWIPSLIIAAIAALGVALAFVASSWAFEAATTVSWFEAAHRSALAQMTIQIADQLQRQHQAPKQIAREVVSRLQSMSDVAAAVVDSNGRLVAGDSALVTDLRFPGPPAGGAVATTNFGPGPLTPPMSVQMGPFENAQPLKGLAPPGASATIREEQTIVNRPPGGVARLMAFGTTTHFLAMRGPDFGYGGEPGLSWLFGNVGMSRTLVPIGTQTVVIGTANDVLARVQNGLRYSALGLLLLTFFVVWFRSRQVLAVAMRPADRVREALVKFSQSVPPKPEILATDGGADGELITAYNTAANKITNAFRNRVEAEYRMRQFVADAGHELRTPLAVIMGYVQLLRHNSKSDDATADRIFSEIDEQGRRISVLIHKLLLLTRWESQEPTDVKILDAADIAAGVVDSFRPLAAGATLNLEVQRDAFIQVSESEMREAIGNLIDNALKYAPGAAIDTTVRATNGFVSVAVSDNGPGMTPEVRAHAFERFARGELGGSISGSGLGLAIVKRVVERAGGTVTLESALGQGTRVELRIPAWHPDATQLSRTPEA